MQRLTGQQLERALERANRDTRTLDERMAAVQAELEDVPRRGHAHVETRTGGAYDYDYITEADLMAGVRPLLAKHGVAVYYSDEIVSINAGMATVRVTLTFRAKGEWIACSAEGVGTDKGDKHVNKAKTSAVRYILWKTFLQPSDDDDPEQENVNAEDAAAAHAARERADALARGGHTGRTDRATAETTAGLVQRISQRSMELDEVHGLAPGTTLGRLQEAVRERDEVAIGQLSAPAIVAIGTALARHVHAEREAYDRDGLDFAATEFELPE